MSPITMPAADSANSSIEQSCAALEPEHVENLARGGSIEANCVTDASERVAAEVRLRQLESVQKFTPLAMTVNIVNAMVVISNSWDTELRLAVALWGACLGAVAAYALWRWWRRRQRVAGPVSECALARVTVHSGLLALLWTTLPLVLIPSADADLQLFLAVVVTGMVGAGAFVLSAVPQAAVVYVATLCLGCAITLLQWSPPDLWSLLAMLGSYALTVTFGAWNAGALLKARVKAEALSAWQREEISCMLADFEASTSEIFWELDASLRFVRASSRLSKLFNLQSTDLVGQPALQLLERRLPADDPAREAWSEVVRRLKGHEAFNGLVLPLGRGLLVRHWTLSGRPLIDRDGTFSGWRGVAADISEFHVTNSRLDWLLKNDELTGLANRQSFGEELATQLREARGGFRPMAVVCINVDGFRRVNEDWGLTVGDEVLKNLAGRLLRATRRHDLVARLGGDEFGIVLRDIGQASDVETHLARLADLLREPIIVGGKRLSPVVSIGTSICPAHGNSPELLLLRAGVALASAKQSGGGHFRIYNTPLAESHRHRVALECALRDAIDTNQFRLEFQPMLSLDSGQVLGFEALLRWDHIGLGCVSPGQFIPLAESMGLMPQLGLWVLREACREAIKWPSDISVSVNVSALQLTEPDFVEKVLTATSCIAPTRVELEITESVLIQNTEEVIAKLISLKSKGYRIALDDFGSGYSALGYLRRFRIDTLKIDRSIVVDVSTNHEARAIVTAIISIARSLEMETVAEGVTTAGEARVLRELACTRAQGYLFSPAMSPVHVTPYLARWSHTPTWLPFSLHDGVARTTAP